MPRGEMRRFDLYCEHYPPEADVNSAGAFGPDLAKKLAQLVKMEKNVMRSMEVSAVPTSNLELPCLANNGPG